MTSKERMEFLRDSAANAKKIANHYGMENQISVAQEELAELIQSISKLRRAGFNASTEHIAARSSVSEEMADVINMMLQLLHLFENEDLVAFWLRQKQSKTLKTLEGK